MPTHQTSWLGSTRSLAYVFWYAGFASYSSKTHVHVQGADVNTLTLLSSGFQKQLWL